MVLPPGGNTTPPCWATRVRKLRYAAAKSLTVGHARYGLPGAAFNFSAWGISSSGGVGRVGEAPALTSPAFFIMLRLMCQSQDQVSNGSAYSLPPITVPRRA